ncbi:MAG: flagellar motor protein MotB [Terriglobales bacterium]
MPDRIIIRKKVPHSGHHGGAWKVAYADFVTAMMALFIVLWLMNSSKQLQEAVGGYFKDPTGTSKKVGSDMHGSGENFFVSKQDMSKIKDELQARIRKISNFDKLSKQIELTITAEGLRIELLEDAQGTFFDLGDATPSPSGKELLTALAQEIGNLPNRVSIEGHTDSKPYQGDGHYSNWELSADRANAARRIMCSAGLREDQVEQVRGFADQHLRNKDNNMDPANRRISLIVQFLQSEPASSPQSESPANESAANPTPGEPSSTEAGK